MQYSTVIIGAGPAGLAAANELIHQGVPGDHILLLEMGPSLDDRVHARVNRHDEYNTYGLGGAGLFSDGKLCVPDETATLFPEIPTLLGTGDAVPNIHIEEAEAKALYRYAFETFQELGVSIRETPSEINGIERLRKSFSDWEVFFEYYHVYQIDADDLPVAIDHLRSRLAAAGVRIATDTRVRDIGYEGPGRIHLQCSNHAGEITHTCKYLIVGVGKIGTAWLQEQADRLGLARAKRPVELGVRVEVAKELLDSFTRIHRDLKLFRRAGARSLTKTFCTCVSGTVVPCRYKEIQDLMVLGGYTGSKPTGNTTFALMTKIDLGDVDPLEYAFSVVRTANIMGQGRAVVQRLGDLRARRASTASGMLANRIATTLSEYTPGDINLVFPAFVVNATLETLAQFDQIIPGIASDDTVISAPCMEYCYRRFEVNRHMETVKPGVYVVGDVTGYAKGIIAASSSGILAGRHVAENLNRAVDRLVRSAPGV
jgi:uncharacterized protein